MFPVASNCVNEFYILDFFRHNFDDDNKIKIYKSPGALAPEEKVLAISCKVKRITWLSS